MLSAPQQGNGFAVASIHLLSYGYIPTACAARLDGYCHLLFGQPMTARPNPLLTPIRFCRDFFGNALGTLPRPINATRDVSPSTAAMLSPVVDW
jgi:hypothetical protein